MYDNREFFRISPVVEDVQRSLSSPRSVREKQICETMKISLPTCIEFEQYSYLPHFQD